MKKKATARRSTTTIRVYEDTHYKLRVHAARQQPKMTLQDVVAAAVENYLKNSGS